MHLFFKNLLWGLLPQGHNCHKLQSMGFWLVGFGVVYLFVLLWWWWCFFCLFFSLGVECRDSFLSPFSLVMGVIFPSHNSLEPQLHCTAGSGSHSLRSQGSSAFTILLMVCRERVSVKLIQKYTWTNTIFNWCFAFCILKSTASCNI